MSHLSFKTKINENEPQPTSEKSDVDSPRPKTEEGSPEKAQVVKIKKPSPEKKNVKAVHPLLKVMIFK